MESRKLILTTNNERLLIISNRSNNTYIARSKQGKYYIITNKDISQVLR